MQRRRNNWSLSTEFNILWQRKRPLHLLEFDLKDYFTKSLKSINLIQERANQALSSQTHQKKRFDHNIIARAPTMIANIDTWTQLKQVLNLSTKISHTLYWSRSWFFFWPSINFDSINFSTHDLLPNHCFIYTWQRLPRSVDHYFYCIKYWNNWLSLYWKMELDRLYLLLHYHLINCGLRRLHTKNRLRQDIHHLLYHHRHWHYSYLHQHHLPPLLLSPAQNKKRKLIEFSWSLQAPKDWAHLGTKRNILRESDGISANFVGNKAEWMLKLIYTN